MCLPNLTYPVSTYSTVQYSTVIVVFVTILKQWRILSLPFAGRYISIPVPESTVAHQTSQRSRPEDNSNACRGDHRYILEHHHPRHTLEEQVALDCQQLSDWESRNNRFDYADFLSMAHASQRFPSELCFEALWLQIRRISAGLVIQFNTIFYFFLRAYLYLICNL